MSFIAIHASAPRGRQILGSTVRERRRDAEFINVRLHFMVLSSYGVNVEWVCPALFVHC